MNQILNYKNSVMNSQPSVIFGTAFSDCSSWFASANKEYLTISSNSSLQTGDIDFEIGGWVRFDSTPAGMTLLAKRAPLDYGIRMNGSSKFGWYLSADGSNITEMAANTFGAATTNTWYFLQIRYIKSTGKMGISVNNGVWDEVSFTGTPYMSTSAFQFGYYSGGTYFNGRLDSWYFTKRITTTAEATALYNAGAGRTYNDLTAANGLDAFKTGLTSWWDFNSESGTQFDSKGTNHLTAAADPIISPTINNGGFEDWTSPTNAAVWSENVAGSSTVNQETTAPYSGSSALRIDVDSSGNNVAVVQNLLILGKKYTATLYAKGSDNTAKLLFGSSPGYIVSTLTTSYALYTNTFTAASTQMYLQNSLSASKSIYIDNVTLTSLGPTAEAGVAAGNAIDGNFGAGFTGTSGQYLSKTSTSSLQTGDIDFEIGAWVFLDSKNAEKDILTKWGSSGAWEYRLIYRSDEDRFRFDFSSNGASLSNMSATDFGSPALNNWYYVRAWHSASADTINIQVNNGAITSKAHSGGGYIGTYQVTLGANGIGTSGLMTGRIDGAYKIDRILTTEEATALYNNGKGLKYAQLPDSIKNDPLLKAYWNLDEKSGTRFDSTSNANHLTDNGGVTQVQGVNYYGGAVSKLTNFASSSNANQITLAKRPTFDSLTLKGSLLFDGVDDGLVISGDKIGVGDVTVFAVINARSFTSISSRILDNSKFLLTIFNNGTLQVSSDSSTLANSSLIAINTSYVISVTRTSAGIVNIYINGKLSGIANQNSGTPAAGSDTYIGNRAAGDRAFDGNIADIQVAKRILTMGEISIATRKLALLHGVAL